MCFVKSSDVKISEIEDTVQQKQANADLTKNSQNNSQKGGYLQNLKTSPLGLEDKDVSNKKTLLGE